MNIPLLKKVRAAILAEPKKFDMTMWFRRERTSPCGTTACIAGHAVAIQLKFNSLKAGLVTEDPWFYWGTKAASILKLTKEEGERLFQLHRWPDEMAIAYEDARTRKLKAEIAAARIDLFIKTNGAE